MSLKFVQLVGAVALVAAVGVMAFFIAGRFTSGDASSEPAEDSDEWVDDLRDRLEPTIQSDSTLPPARGVFGEFLVVGMDSSDPYTQYPCTPSGDGPTDDAQRVLASELSSPAFDGVVEAFECTNGTIYTISGTVQQELGITEFARLYYVGDAIARSEAPEERLEVTTIRDRPALIEHDLDLSPFPSQTRIFVLERAPNNDEPGIMLRVFTMNGVDEGIELAEELMQ